MFASLVECYKAMGTTEKSVVSNSSDDFASVPPAIFAFFRVRRRLRDARSAPVAWCDSYVAVRTGVVVAVGGLGRVRGCTVLLCATAVHRRVSLLPEAST